MAYKIPRGCQDVFGEQSYKWQALEQTLRTFCYIYNYDEIRTPIFEHTEVFKREMIQVTWSIKKCILLNLKIQKHH